MNPPIFSLFQATIVRAIKIKLGIKCIKSANGQLGSPKTSNANMLIKAIYKTAKILGSQRTNFFILKYLIFQFYIVTIGNNFYKTCIGNDFPKYRHLFKL